MVNPAADVNRAALRLAGMVVLVFSSACGSKHDAEASPPARADSTIKRKTDSARPNVNRAAASDSLARLIAGRKAHDSVSYMSAIRFGRRKAESWPAGPAPLGGALLPAKR